ncbi:MAG: DUF2550 domain-containing protein [Lawsonella sp.]
MWWIIVAVSIVLLVLAAALIFLYMSMTALRNKGTGVVLRFLPAEGDHGWRHGILVYDEDSVAFYMLRKLVNKRTAVFERDEIHIKARRSPRDREREMMDDTVRIVHLSGGGVDVEMALEPSAHAALLSWLESRPSKRLYSPGL